MTSTAFARAAIPAVAALAFGALQAWILSWTDGLVGADSPFHIAYAHHWRESGFPWDLPHMSATLFAEHWVDHQLLYHAMLLPFAGEDLVAGGRASAIFFAGVVGLCAALLLRRCHPAVAAGALVALMGAGPALLWRLSMVRTQALALGLLMLALLALQRRKVIPAVVVGYVFALSYQAAVLLGLLAALWVAAHAVLRQPVRPAVRGAEALLGGAVAGFVVNPYFPDTLGFLVAHVGFKVINPNRMPVGSEWEAVSPVALVSGTPVALVLFVAAAALAVAAWRAGRLRPLQLTVVTFAAITVPASLVAGKFLEYFAPLGVLSAALLLADLPRGRRAAGAALALIGLIGLVWVRVDLKPEIQATPPIDRWAGSCAWIRGNVPPDEVIFHFDWGEFPELFFHDRSHRYVVGLDPNFMDLWDHELATTYLQLGRGEHPDPVGAIRGEFGARYVFVGMHRPDALMALGADPRAEIVFSDDTSAVIRLGD